jgi:SAM-dependent methyltransferase
MVQHFSLGPGSKVLDLMCGYGRHAIALAERGIQVTAIDNLESYTSELEKTVNERSLPIKVIKNNVYKFNSTELFDLAICMGNSLNFFDYAESNRIFQNLSHIIKPNGFFLINSWSIAEIAIKQFTEKTWSRIGEYKFLTESEFSFNPTKINTESIIIDDKGTMETKIGVDYIYSINEYLYLLKDAGFTLTELFSVPGKKKFKIGDPRIYMVSQKIQ